MNNDEEDEIVSRMPVRLSHGLGEKIHIHQYPLLLRPLQVPPSAAASGKRISARIKPKTRRIEVHVPADTRTDVWNAEKGQMLGMAQVEDDEEKNQTAKVKLKEGEEPRLSHVRMRSEEVPQRGAYMLGVVHNGQLHLHPVSQTHQFRPTLTYLDVLSRKSRRGHGGGGSDSDSDDGPPPDPDDPTPIIAPVKKEKKAAAEAREVQVSARKADEKSGLQFGAGLSTARKEMLVAIHAEEDEPWQSLTFYGEQDSGHVFQSVLSKSEEPLVSRSEMPSFLKDIPGL